MAEEQQHGLAEIWPPRVHNRFGGMWDLAIFRGDIYSGCELKTGVACGNFNNQREQDFLFLWGWDAGIVREK